MIKAIIWDLDGVIADTGNVHFEAWKQTLTEEGVIITRKQFDQTLGMNNKAIISQLVGNGNKTEQYDLIGERKEEFFRKHISKVKILPGVMESLIMFQNMDFSQAIASSAPMENIAAVVQIFELGEYFDALVSGAALPGKPDPATFLAAAKQLQADPQDCLVIEDSIHGIKAARNAGMYALAVANSFPRIELYEANCIIESLQELLDGSIESILASFSKK